MAPPLSDEPLLQLLWLLVLAIPIAAVAWTVTHEEVFRELREACQHRQSCARSAAARKFYYVWTCEYCFSHYVTIGFLWLTRFRLLLDDWRGYVLAFFALVWVANTYMSLHRLIRLDIKTEGLDATVKEKRVRELHDAERRADSED